MTVPAILCDAPPLLKTKKVQAHANCLPKQRKRAQYLGNHRGHDELSPKTRGTRQVQTGRPFNDGEKRAEQ